MDIKWSTHTIYQTISLMLKITIHVHSYIKNFILGYQKIL